MTLYFKRVMLFSWMILLPTYLKLLGLVDHFKFYTVNLTTKCTCPIETYVSHCGRYRSTIDYLFLPNCLSDDIMSAETFGLALENTSDHIPLLVQCKIPGDPATFSKVPGSGSDKTKS